MHSSVAGPGTADDVDGTSLVGYVTTTYAVLEAAFGTPVSGPRWVFRKGTRQDKTSCEWNVRFKDGTVATIYDYGSHVAGPATKTGRPTASRSSLPPWSYKSGGTDLRATADWESQLRS